jgi:SET domain-containing protein
MVPPQEDVSYYFNHSCAPNCWYKEDKYLVASRDIQVTHQMTPRAV